MPEGHVIHRIAEEQNSLFAGQTVLLESPQGRFSNEAAELTGYRLKRIVPVGKHLFYHFEDSAENENSIVHVHLGLYGKYKSFSNPPAEPIGAVRLRLIGHSHGFDLNGPNRCELIGEEEMQSILDRLGEDPLQLTASPDRAWNRFHRTSVPVGSVLLNQSIICGIGNIYRTEILFLLGISPQTPANELTRAQFDQIWELSVELMSIGKRLNRIVTRNWSGVLNARGKIPRERFNIYKRPECPECGDSIYYWSLANRTVYACESCQPFPA